MKEVAHKVTEMDEKYAELSPSALDFSPDGKYLAANSDHDKINIWDWRSGRIVRTVEKTSGAEDSLATERLRFSPDGRLFVSCQGQGDGGVVARVWSTSTWALVRDITDSNHGSCSAVAFTPDEKSLIVVLDRPPISPGDTLVVYDPSLWQPIWGLRTIPFYPKALAISPDGKFAAIGGGKYDDKGTLTQQIALVDLEQRKIVRTIQNTVALDFGQLAWSPDGAHVAAIGRRAQDYSISKQAIVYHSGLDTLMIFDAHSGKQVAGEQLGDMTYSEDPGDIGNGYVRYTPDGRYLIEAVNNGLGSGSGVRIWDGQHRALLQEIPAKMNSLAVTRDGRYFAIGIQGKTQVWQLR